jgi:enterochelin esterase-like enzyme
MRQIIALTVVIMVYVYNANSQNTVTPAPAGIYIFRSDIHQGNTDTITCNSKTVGKKRKTLIYTPTGYLKDMKLPLLYLLHGIGGDEKAWLNYGQPQVILDSLYAEKKDKMMILVLPNGRAMKADRPAGNIMAFDKVEAFSTFEKDLLKDLIPYTEKNYPIINNSEHCAIAWKNFHTLISIFDELKIKYTFSKYPGGNTWPV